MAPVRAAAATLHVAAGTEAPAQLDGVREADARADRHLRLAPDADARADQDRASRQRRAVLVEANAQRLRELARPRAEVAVARWALRDEPTAFAHQLETRQRRQRTDQHPGADAVGLADRVEHRVDAV